MQRPSTLSVSQRTKTHAYWHQRSWWVMQQLQFMQEKSIYKKPTSISLSPLPSLPQPIYWQCELYSYPTTEFLVNLTLISWNTRFSNRTWQAFFTFLSKRSRRSRGPNSWNSWFTFVTCQRLLKFKYHCTHSFDDCVCANTNNPISADCNSVLCTPALQGNSYNNCVLGASWKRHFKSSRVQMQCSRLTGTNKTIMYIANNF